MVSEGILDIDRQVREYDDVGHTPALFDRNHDRPTSVPASDLAGYVAVLVPNFLVAVQLHFHHPFLDLLVLSVVYYSYNSRLSCGLIIKARKGRFSRIIKRL